MAYDGLRVSVGMRLKTQYDGLLLAALLLGPALLAASRDLDWFDGPELALAAVIGGVAHPPGEPLHTLLAGLLARLMPAYLGVALASVLPLCLLAVPMIRLVDHLSPPASGRDRLLRGAVVAATLLGPPSFQTGTRVEVYCLAALFSLLGTMYGGNGKSNFALPDFQGCAPIQHGQGPGLSDYFIGETGGAEFVSLLESEIPGHTHALQASTNPGSSNNPDRKSVV